jgi:aryl-alcohol dehydrogenase-like predicted oxidoreductase
LSPAKRVIGRILQEQIEAGAIQRDEIVVISKVGYLQGFNYALAQHRKQEGRPFPNLVKYSETIDHCIHPDFLADQLSRTLERLNLQTVDGYLLHHPEHYLKWTKRAHQTRESARQEYDRRIQEAFAFLETAVQQGLIQWYGVSATTFAEPANYFQHTNLHHLLQCAHELSPENHFRIIQLPLNLLEPDAALVQNQPGGQTTLQLAHQQKIAVLGCRPLAVPHSDILPRLAEVPMPNYPAPPEDVSTAVDTLLALERPLQQEILPQLTLDADTAQTISDYLRIGTLLDGQWAGMGSHQDWLEIRSQFILKRAQTAVEFLAQQADLSVTALEWLEHYVDAVNEAVAAVTAYYQEIAAKQVQSIQQAASAASADWTGATLSQTAVRAVRSTEGISCVVVNMHQQAHVQEMLHELQHPVTVQARQSAWQQMSQAQHIK